MTYAALLISAALLTGCATKRTHVEFTPERLGKFHHHYQKLMREYLACPEWAVRLDECRGMEFGTLNLHELRAAQEVGIF